MGHVAAFIHVALGLAACHEGICDELPWCHEIRRGRVIAPWAPEPNMVIADAD